MIIILNVYNIIVNARYLRYSCRAKYFDPEQDKMVQNLVKPESISLTFAFSDFESLCEILVLCELVKN